MALRCVRTAAFHVPATVDCIQGAHQSLGFHGLFRGEQIRGVLILATQIQQHHLSLGVAETLSADLLQSRLDGFDDQSAVVGRVSCSTNSTASWSGGAIASYVMPMMRTSALLQRLAAVRGRLSLCADQAAAAKWWLSMPMASVSAEGPMPKALSTRRTSPLMPGCRHQGRACPLRRARMTSNPLIVA